MTESHYGIAFSNILTAERLHFLDILKMRKFRIFKVFEIP